MDPSAFVTSFTGSSLTNGASLISKVSPRRPSPSARGPVAILGSRPATQTFGAKETIPTYKVKVMQKDRCTQIEVDRDTDLRTALLANKVDVYTLGGKLRNCGGGGQCGTCLIEVEDGVYSTNGRTPREEFMLEQKPASWRLACRTMITGDVTIRTKPQA